MRASVYGYILSINISMNAKKKKRARKRSCTYFM